MSNNTQQDKGAHVADRAAYFPRLPCRGCSSDCRYYAKCDGRPWRTLFDLGSCMVNDLADDTSLPVLEPK